MFPTGSPAGEETPLFITAMPRLHLDAALFILFHLRTLCFSDSCRSELEQLANNAACDLIGLVTFAGRVQRVRSKGNKGLCFIFQLNWFLHLFMFTHVHLLAPERYWTYRWLHAVDGTSDLPFVLELYSSSQPEIFSQICPSEPHHLKYYLCCLTRNLSFFS